MSFLRLCEAERRRGRGAPPNLLPACEIREYHRSYSPSTVPSGMSDDLSKTSSIFTSKTALDKLERTDISKLLLEEFATGKYVLVRCIEKGQITTGWNTVVEDHVGNVCTFSVFNYPLQELFSPGTVLIIKEPYLRIDNVQSVSLEDMTLECMYAILCKCPTDILVLRPSHHLFHFTKNVKWVNELRNPATDPLMLPPLPSTALKWKERGDSFFDKNELILAREAYFLGLELCKDININHEKLLNLNMLAVHVELGCYEKAIEVGERILNKFPNKKKAVFQLGKAYYMVRKFEEAFRLLEKFCQIFPNDKKGMEELQRIQERLKERNGEFDLVGMQRLAEQDPTKEIDCADYDGPVEVKEIPGKGRGLVLTKDVKKDTIVIVSKALAATLNSALPNRPYLETMEIYIAEIILKLIPMVNNNPNLFGLPVFRLSSQPRLWNEPIQLFCDPELKQEPMCDMDRLKFICYHNHFLFENWKTGVGYGAGLFILPSYLNHSCEPNVDQKYYNDVMVVTAKTDLKAGTELTISYFNEDLSYDDRVMHLNLSWFKCDCNKCKRRI